LSSHSPFGPSGAIPRTASPPGRFILSAKFAGKFNEMFPSRNIEINQPYIHILQNLAMSGSLDDNVVEVLTENYDEIDRGNRKWNLRR
jgi:hypothetical protein